MTDPTFQTREELDAWARGRLDQFMADAPYSTNQVKLMLTVANEIRRVTLAHEHLRRK